MRTTALRLCRLAFILALMTIAPARQAAHAQPVEPEAPASAGRTADTEPSLKPQSQAHLAPSQRRDLTGPTVVQTAIAAAQRSLVATSAPEPVTMGWKPMTLTARYWHAMAYDSARGVVVLFGGFDGTLRDDTWEWDGTNWLQRNPANHPSARQGHSMTYDSARGVVVLFGGDDGAYRDDTWEWDGTNWLERSPASHPPARRLHAMAYDSQRGVVVLFGGGDDSSYLDDTWEWDGTQWLQRNPANHPAARNVHATAYDVARGVVVLFGGNDTIGGHRDDHWEWDGMDWVQRSPANRPPARREHAMAYDSARAVVVLFGGCCYQNDTWEWNGSNWVQRSPASPPAARDGHAMAYDGTRGAVVLFGGWAGPYGPSVDDTWGWDGTNWVEFRPPQYSVAVAIVGQGSVENTPGNPYLYGEVATLKPIPATGGLFEGWGGPHVAELIDHGDGTWSLTMDTDKAVTANFTSPQYDVTVTVEGSGTVEKHPTPPYDYGTWVLLVPTPVAGGEFLGWGGPNASDLVNNGNGTWAVFMNGHKQLTASFTELTYVVQVTISPAASGTVLNTPGNPYLYGEVATLKPMPATGWLFDGWSGPDAGDLTGNGNGTWSVTMDSDKAVTAAFTTPRYSVAVTIVGQGSVENTPGNPYLHGEVATLEPIGAVDWAFAGWSGPDAGGLVDNGKSTWSLSMNSDKEVTATFIKNKIKAYLPFVPTGWPPIPDPPVLTGINNADQDNFYAISWNWPRSATSFVLQEANSVSFSDARGVWQGRGNAWYVPSPGKSPGTYYYHVMAQSNWGQSAWSNVQAVTVYPLFVGLQLRRDGSGYVRGDLYENLGYHEVRQLNELTDPDTVRSHNYAWYDPNPEGFPSENWDEYYSVSTGAYRSSPVPADPSWKWGYPWFLSYQAQLADQQQILVDGQQFFVSGPHWGYTSFGRAVRYWHLVNKNKFLLFDAGGDEQQYVHPGDITLWYDAGATRLLLHDDVLRRVYWQGDLTNITVQYVINLTCATSFAGVETCSGETHASREPVFESAHSEKAGMYSRGSFRVSGSVP